MWKRLLALLGVVIVLVVPLFHSQVRREPLKVSGFVEADEIRLGSRVGGRVAQVHCEEGKEVLPGSLLISLEAFDFVERRAEAAANLAARQAELDRLKNGLRDEEIAQAQARVDRLSAVASKLKKGPREEEIKAAQARLELATAQVKRAEQSYHRYQDLFAKKTGAVTPEDVDRATEELTVAEKNQEVRQQELQLLEKGTREEDLAAAGAELEEARQAHRLAKRGYRKEDVQRAEAAVDAAQAALAAVETQMRELQVTCPVKGVVEAVELQPGDLVAAGAPVLAILDTSRLWVRCYVPENRLHVALNQEVLVTTDSFPDAKFRACVTFISSQAEFTPNNVQTPDERSKQVFRLKVTLLEGLDKLRPGMPVDVWLES